MYFLKFFCFVLTIQFKVSFDTMLNVWYRHHKKYVGRELWASMKAAGPASSLQEATPFPLVLVKEGIFGQRKAGRLRLDREAELHWGPGVSCPVEVLECHLLLPPSLVRAGPRVLSTGQSWHPAPLRLRFCPFSHLSSPCLRNPPTPISPSRPRPTLPAGSLPPPAYSQQLPFPRKEIYNCLVNDLQLPCQSSEGILILRGTPLMVAYLPQGTCVLKDGNWFRPNAVKLAGSTVAVSLWRGSFFGSHLSLWNIPSL